jgi:3-deoxy-D-arabino-heptulosonate 7-phosphate (DAHP) synthase
MKIKNINKIKRRKTLKNKRKQNEIRKENEKEMNNNQARKTISIVVGPCSCAQWWVVSRASRMQHPRSPSLGARL